MAKKNILVICAQPEELDGVFYQQEKKVHSDGIYLLEGENFNAYVTIGGIGKTAIAFRLGQLLSQLSVDLIINTGVAGSLSSEVKPFEIFVSEKAAYYDVDVRAFGYALGQMCGQPLYYPADKKALKAALSLFDNRIHAGLVLSGDNFISKENLPSFIYTAFDHPMAIDMESAAVAQVSNIAHVPYLVIRAISDTPSDEDNNKDTYNNRLDEACAEAGKITYKIMNEYSK